MASEGSAPPPYNPMHDNPPNPNNHPPPQAYPNQAPYPPTAPPSYSSQDPSKAYPPQPYPQQGVPPPPGYPQPGYGQPVYAAHGAAPGYTTQAVHGVNYYPHNQTTVITQQPGGGGIILHTAPPPDFMAMSIISLVCCFCIGIFAVLKSVKSRELYRTGDHAGAQDMGLRARKLAQIGIFVAVLLYVFIVVLRIVLSVVFDTSSSE